jgi:hypothetical protein
LEKTIAYVHELRTQNLALVKQTVDAGIILHENDVLRDRVCSRLKSLNFNSLFSFKIRVIEQENGVLKSLLTKQSLLGSNESSSSST